MNYGIKITSNWTAKAYLFPTLFSDKDEAKKAMAKLPHNSVNNILEVVEIK